MFSKKLFFIFLILIAPLGTSHTAHASNAKRLFANFEQQLFPTFICVMAIMIMSKIFSPRYITQEHVEKLLKKQKTDFEKLINNLKEQLLEKQKKITELENTIKETKESTLQELTKVSIVLKEATEKNTEALKSNTKATDETNTLNEKIKTFIEAQKERIEQLNRTCKELKKQVEIDKKIIKKITKQNAQTLEKKEKDFSEIKNKVLLELDQTTYKTAILIQNNDQRILSKLLKIIKPFQQLLQNTNFLDVMRNFLNRSESPRNADNRYITNFDQKKIEQQNKTIVPLQNNQNNHQIDLLNLNIFDQNKQQFMIYQLKND